MKSSRLPLHEWSIILLFCFILLGLGCFALKAKPRSSLAVCLPVESQPEETSTILLVNIQGQVVKPGLYRLPPNATLKQALEQVQLLPTADVSQLNGRRKIRDKQTINIPERRWITITVKGAVQQIGSMQILSGTRCCEWVKQLTVLPDADLRSLNKRRRFLQEGDVIEVPFKKAKQIIR